MTTLPTAINPLLDFRNLTYTFATIARNQASPSFTAEVCDATNDSQFCIFSALKIVKEFDFSVRDLFCMKYFRRFIRQDQNIFWSGMHKWSVTGHDSIKEIKEWKNGSKYKVLTCDATMSYLKLLRSARKTLPECFSILKCPATLIF